MKYQIDHDLHIHSYLSTCSGDPDQNPENLLRLAERDGLSVLCLTDHFWDSDVPGASEWYKPQDYEHVSRILPLPQSESVKFWFGCETDLDKYMRLGISRERMDRFDFVIIPTTHLHMPDNIDVADRTLEGRERKYAERLDGVLDMDLPFHKTGIAHLTTHLIAPDHFEDHLKVLEMITDDTFCRLFEKAAQKGPGIELNFHVSAYTPQQLEVILRPYRIAKECGCKFYFGSDAHHPSSLDDRLENFTRIRDLLKLEESDRFDPFLAK